MTVYIVAAVVYENTNRVDGGDPSYEDYGVAVQHWDAKAFLDQEKAKVYKLDKEVERLGWEENLLGYVYSLEDLFDATNQSKGREFIKKHNLYDDLHYTLSLSECKEEVKKEFLSLTCLEFWSIVPMELEVNSHDLANALADQSQ